MSKFQWWNFELGMYDDAEPQNDKIAMQYIPRDGISQNLYLLLRQRGDSILDAMVYVLSAGLPEKEVVA